MRDIEKFRAGITEEILVLDLVNKLDKEEKFLDAKIKESIKMYLVEFDNKQKIKNAGIQKLRDNRLLLDFLGEENLAVIEETYKK